MAQSGEGLKERIRTYTVRALDRPQHREQILARLRGVARDEEDSLADLRRLVEERPPRSWHL